MKIKEAIKILQDFQQIAGEDAECDIGGPRLQSVVEIEYERGYGYSYCNSNREKSRKVFYKVISEREADARPLQERMSDVHFATD